MSDFEKYERPGGNGFSPSRSPDAKEEYDVERKSSTNAQGRRMSRIAPPSRKLSGAPNGDDNAQASLVEMEADNAIKYRTCPWWKTAFLLFSEYICLAMMSFPYSYSVLGLVPGLILTVVQAAFVLYTSLVVWCVEFSPRYVQR